MATLQKFKLLAMQCGVAQSPTQSPRTSPLVQLRQPKTTLRTLLCLSPSPRRQEHVLEKKEKDPIPMRRHSLKDLFVSSPPRQEEEQLHASTPMLGSLAVGNTGLVGSNIWRYRPGSTNPVSTGFRCRSLLKRKAWRPLLLAIPE